MKSPDLLPDPLAFAAEALAARGALVDPEGERATAVLPPDLCALLELPDAITLTAAPPGPGETSCALGSLLLERLITDARAGSPFARVKLDREPPRPAQAKALAERFTVRNGVTDILAVGTREVLYLALWGAYVAEADDRSEGIIPVVGRVPDGAVPDAAFVEQIDPTGPMLDMVAARPDIPPPAGFDRLLARLEVDARGATASFVERTRARHTRDHERIDEYHEALARETRGAKRKVDPKTLKQKLERIAAERDAKLSDLPARFAVRVTLRVGAALLVVAPSATVQLRVRRRKDARELALVLPSGATELDALACDGCTGATSRPALCDDRLHVLCELCAPVAQGRIPCPACDHGAKRG